MSDCPRVSGYLLQFDRSLPNGDLVVPDATIRTSHSVPVHDYSEPGTLLGRTEVMIRDDVGIWVEIVLREALRAPQYRLIPRCEIVQGRRETRTVVPVPAPPIARRHPLSEPGKSAASKTGTATLNGGPRPGKIRLRVPREILELRLLGAYLYFRSVSARTETPELVRSTPK